MKKTVSLQTKLIHSSVWSSVLAGLISLIILTGLLFYHTMELHDDLMEEIADILVVSDISLQQGAQIDELSDEFSIGYQLSNDHYILTHSDEFNLTYVSSTYDFSFFWADHTIWRSYVADKNGMRVMLYQPISVRIEDLAESLGIFCAVLVLLWLLQWGLVRYVIQGQFKRLKQLSLHISEKNAQDLSPIQQTEPEFYELQPIITQLNKLFSRLDQALTAEQRFTADASHELRSPLSAIQMRLQVLQRKYQQHPNLTQDLNPIYTDVARSTQILENLLLLARLDPSETQDLPKTHFEFKGLMNDVVHALTPFIEEKNIRIEQHVEHIKIYANRELIFTCVRNLLDNAVRYATAASVVHIHFEHSCLRVVNDGALVSPEVIAHLGERFYRALGTQTQGSGLGISICKKIIALHDGHLNFQAREQGGLIVKVEFKTKKSSMY